MRNQLYGLLAVACWLLLCGGQAAGYEYPFTDPYVATVLGTPSKYAEVLPEDVKAREETIVVFPERRIPGILWNLSELSYSYLGQEGPAPLIFMIAGTGSSFRSGKMQMMQKAFFQAGFHVVSLSSPTHPNFVAAASTSSVPGHLEEDSADLYRVMRLIWQELHGRLEVTDFHLTGYSLGGAQSAFISRLDEREKVFNFRRVLMINPPVSLYNSVNRIDTLLEESIPGGLDNFAAFYRDVIRAFGETYAHGDKVEFNDEFLYEAYKYHQPKESWPLAALIGVSFRAFCENMVFTSDVMTRAGYVVPRNLELNRHAPLTPYLKTLSRLTFLDYFQGIFMPHFQAQNPGISEQEMIRQTSLMAIEQYLRSSQKIGLIHNRDDVILLPGEVDYLEQLFGDRAVIFPRGGHCGNMAYPENVAAMVGFFTKAQP